MRTRLNVTLHVHYVSCNIQCVPPATEPGISLIVLPLMRIFQRNLKRTTDTFLFISHTKNVLLFKFRCNIFIGATIIKEMPDSVASGTPCITLTAEAPVRSQVSPCEIYSRQSGTGIRVLRFPSLNIIPPLLPTHLHLHAALTRRTNGRILGTFQKGIFSRKSGSVG